LSRCEPAAEWLAKYHAERLAKYHAERFAKYHAERLAHHDTHDTYDVVHGEPEP